VTGFEPACFDTFMAGSNWLSRCLNVGNYDSRDHVSYVRQSVAKAAAEGLRADGDSEGDEDDEHSVFGGRGAALVPINPSISLSPPGVFGPPG